MEAEIREAFQDSQKYACGIGSAGTVANKICDIVYGTDCLWQHCVIIVVYGFWVSIYRNIWVPLLF